MMQRLLFPFEHITRKSPLVGKTHATMVTALKTNPKTNRKGEHCYERSREKSEFETFISVQLFRDLLRYQSSVMEACELSIIKYILFAFNLVFAVSIYIIYIKC